MQNVTIDRDKFIGGSDIPIILNRKAWEGWDIVTDKPLKKDRYGLLREKAGLAIFKEVGNQYTEYGNVMEGKIRDYLNTCRKKPFLEDKVESGDLRYHSDGFDGSVVLEVKTTSEIHDDVNDYLVYLPQLIFGLIMHNAKKGLLAVYERPADFSEDFNPFLLHLYDINRKDYKELEEEINEGLERFRRDLAKVKENPELTVEDLKPNDLAANVSELLDLHRYIEELKQKEETLKEETLALFEKYGEKGWNTEAGRVTPKKGTPAKKVMKFDAKLFEKEQPELFSKYSVEAEQAERKASLIITLA